MRYLMSLAILFYVFLIQAVMLEIHPTEVLAEPLPLETYVGHPSRASLVDGRSLIDDTPIQYDFEAEWAAYQNDASTERHFGRMVLELGVGIAGGTLWYWANKEFNDGDWDLDASLDSLWRKIKGEAVRFDSNTFYVNTFNHPFTGAAYYTVGRANGFSAFESFLVSLAASTVWEYFAEYLELVSINDQVFSPFGGAAVGEVFYQLGEFFSTSAPTPVNSALKWVFGATQNIHRRLDGVSPRRARSIDRFGFRDDIWHRFDIRSGVGVAAQRVVGNLELESQIIHLPGYGTQAGEVSSFLTRTMFTQLHFSSSFNAGGLQDLSVFINALLLGYYHQKLSRDADGALRGTSFILGPVLGYELSGHDWRETGIDDRYAMVHILGPRLDLAIWCQGTRLRLTLDASGDFAAIHAFALDAFREVATTEFAKAVLDERGYYFALGFTTRMRVTFNTRAVEVGVGGRYSYYDSIEGVDRREEEITQDVDTTDEIASVRIWMTHNLFDGPMQFALSYEKLWRSGTASGGDHSVRESETENRFLGSLRFLF